MRASSALQTAIRRLPLTTKQGPHNYYKGNRTGAMGTHTKWGGYKIDWRKVRTYVYPDLTGFNMTPFVARRIEEPPKEELTDEENVGDWIQGWKEEGGEQ